MTFYLATNKEAADAAEAKIFAAFRDQVAATDPDAIAEDGTIIGRNAATGKLMPDATRTTGYFGKPQAAVQGWFHPQPGDKNLQLADPSATGVKVVANLNPWPALDPGGAAKPPPTWVQPTGASDSYPKSVWVTHGGYNYYSLIDANVWEPSPQSTLWQISPIPPPLPWVQPTGAHNAYKINAEVTHTYPGRSVKQWKSKIAANTTQPGADGTFDRWWEPVTVAPTTPQPWTQPMPGTARVPYLLDEKCTADGKTWKSTHFQNVWPPTGAGAWGWVEVQT